MSRRKPAARSIASATASCWPKAARASCSRTKSSPASAARSIYAEMLGYGQSADAYNLVAVDPSGEGVALALDRALTHSRDHASRTSITSTRTRPPRPLGDQAEARALAPRPGGRRPPLRGQLHQEHARPRAWAPPAPSRASPRSCASSHGIIPPTINYEYPDPESGAGFRSASRPASKRGRRAVHLVRLRRPQQRRGFAKYRGDDGLREQSR